MEFRFFEPWHAFLPRDPGQEVVLAGAGAKAELARACGAALAAEGAGEVALTLADRETERPLLVHGPNEPRWPTATSLAILVMGAEAAGMRADAAVDGTGTGSLPAPTGVWEWDHTAALLLGEDGWLARVPSDVPAVLALTGLADQPDAVGLFDFVGRVMADPRLPIVLFCDLAVSPPTIRAACREDTASEPE